MKSAWKLCAILFLATSLVAQTSTAPKPKKPKAKATAITAADVQALKDAIASQQAALAQQGQQIQELRDALQRKDQAVQQALFLAWKVSYYVCAKRLLPSLPTLVTLLEQHGHLCLTGILRNLADQGCGILRS